VRRSPIAASLLALATLLVAFPAPAQAVTTSEAEVYLMRWINQARVDRGLVSLTGWGTLHGVADQRAKRLASLNTLSHTAPGNLGSQLTSAGADWYRYGETLAYANLRDPLDAARRLFSAWRGSSAHWSLLMSSRFNYIGAGLALRSSSDRTFGVIVLTDSPDHSPPTAAMTSVSRSGDDVAWSWTGADRRLQTRTAGLRDFDVQLRIHGPGWVTSWVTRRNDTTTRSMVLRDLAGDRRYEVRVRATDRRGNVSGWSAPKAVSVP
jgi:uncharacterized protein YkwD